jgi:hypothetical protein
LNRGWPWQAPKVAGPDALKYIDTMSRRPPLLHLMLVLALVCNGLGLQLPAHAHAAAHATAHALAEADASSLAMQDEDTPPCHNDDTNVTMHDAAAAPVAGPATLGGSYPDHGSRSVDIDASDCCAQGDCDGACSQVVTAMVVAAGSPDACMVRQAGPRTPTSAIVTSACGQPIRPPIA